MSKWPAARIYAKANALLSTDHSPTSPDDRVAVLWRSARGAIGTIDGGASQSNNYGRHTTIFFTNCVVP